MEISVQVTGIDDLLAKLEKLDDETVAAVLKPALKEAADTIRDEAKRLAPVYAGPPRADVTPGELKNSIKSKVTTKKGMLTARVETGAGDFKGDQYYAAFVEFGHHVGKRPGKGAEDARGWVNPHPFLRPAFDKLKTSVIAGIGDAIREALERLTK